VQQTHPYALQAGAVENILKKNTTNNHITIYGKTMQNTKCLYDNKINKILISKVERKRESYSET